MGSVRILAGLGLVVLASCATGESATEEMGNGGAKSDAGKDSSAVDASGGAGGSAGKGGNGGGSGVGGSSGSSGSGGVSGSGGSSGTGGVSGSGGKAGSGGAAGTGGTAGSAGSGGSAGTAGAGGKAGSGGAAGSAGAGGSAGTAGSAGSGGSGGAAGTGGVAGSAGTGGSAGVAGSAGTGGSAGVAGSAGTGGSGGNSCTPPVSGTCDTVPQCGCAVGQNCDVVSLSGASACVSAGTVAAYNNCSQQGECKAGYSCVGGVCKAFCNTKAECTGSSYRSCDQVESSSTPIPSFLVCSQQCNIMNPVTSNTTFKPCGSNVQCIPTEAGASDCIGPAGNGTDGDACSSTMDCSPGFSCITVGSDSMCLAWCRPGNWDCDLFYSCTTLTPSVMVGTTEYGVCW